MLEGIFLSFVFDIFQNITNYEIKMREIGGKLFFRELYCSNSVTTMRDRYKI